MSPQAAPALPPPGDAAGPGSDRPEDDVQLPLMAHLEELRRRLKYAVAALVAAVFGCYFFAEKILWWLMAPVMAALKKMPLQPGIPHDTLAVHDSLEYFMVLLRVSLYAGLFLAAPVILYQLWAFVAPGLYRREKQLALPFVVLGSLFFVAGGLFARLLVLPYALTYLVTGFAHPHLMQVFSIDAELDLVLASVLGFGLVFELPIVLTLLAQFGLISSKFLSKWRRHAIVVNVTAAAIITPTTDPFNLSLMAVPLIVCYELGILGARIVERRKARLAREAGTPPPEPSR